MVKNQSISLLPWSLNMATIETDLGQILERLDARLDRLEQKIDSNQTRTDETLNSLRVSQAEIKGEIKALDEKINGIGKLLENQEFTNRSILATLVIGVIVGTIKFLGIFPNP